MNEPLDLDEQERLCRCVVGPDSDPSGIARLVDDLQRNSLRLIAELREARVKIDSEGAVLAMAVARLGGMVEGRPILRLNFLQRIDELRDIERRDHQTRRYHRHNWTPRLRVICRCWYPW